jgi:hypothetical protein
MRKLSHLGLLVLLCGASLDVAYAWNATFSKGKVALKKDGPLPDAQLSFGEIKVAYPEGQGASLGQGWDFVTNRKTNASCIQFRQASRDYQNASLHSIETVDLETLAISLNANFSGSVNGSVGVFSGSAQSSTTLSASYSTASKDQTYVVQASVAQAATFVTPDRGVDENLIQDKSAETTRTVETTRTGDTTKNGDTTKPGDTKSNDTTKTGDSTHTTDTSHTSTKSGDPTKLGDTTKIVETTKTVDTKKTGDDTRTIETTKILDTTKPYKEAPAYQVKMLPDMLAMAVDPKDPKKLGKDYEKFRATCGDGFISSIVSGADLYLLFHFHDFNQKTRIDLSNSVKASGGMGSVFGGSGSSSLQTTVAYAQDHNQLSIEFLQLGGIIQSLPIDLATAKAKVQELPTEAHNGPRPLYMVIVPYSELPEMKDAAFLRGPDLRQRAARYFTRIQSVFGEVLQIENNYYRDRTAAQDAEDKDAPGRKDEYYYSYYHRQRSEDISTLRELIRAQVILAATIVRDFDQSDCKDATKLASCLRFTPTQSWSGENCKPPAPAPASSDPTCADLQTRINKTAPGDESSVLDDLMYWIMLPIPMNAISDVSKAEIENSANPADRRKEIYAQYVFRHWVERISQIRCSLFFECLSAAERKSYYDSIIAEPAPTVAVLKEVPAPGFAGVDKAVLVPRGYLVTITQRHTDDRSMAYDLFINDGSGWRLYGKQIDASSGFTKIYGPTWSDVIIGTRGYQCDEWGLGPFCWPTESARAVQPAKPLNIDIWYWDPGESTGADSKHNLEVKIQVTPNPVFPN